MPVYWPGGVRYRGGVSSVWGLRTEQGKAWARYGARATGGGRERECAERRKLRGAEYRRGAGGGPARNSGESPVMGAERRGRHRGLFSEQPGSSGRRRVGNQGRKKIVSDTEAPDGSGVKSVAVRGGRGWNGSRSRSSRRAREQHLQDVEPDVLGDIFPGSGAGSRNTEAWGA